MAVLDRLKAKLPAGGDLSKKLLKGKFFTRRGASSADTGSDLPSETLMAVPAEPAATPPPAEKPKKPSLAAALLKGRGKKQSPEADGGPTEDRIARALRRSQMEAELAAPLQRRLYMSDPDQLPEQPAPQAPIPEPEATPTDASSPALLTKAEAEALVIAVTQPLPEEDLLAPPRPVADARSTALIALGGDADLDPAALAARVEQRTGLVASIEEQGPDLRLAFPSLTVLISQMARPLTEAELLNLLYPDEDEWQAIKTQFAAMTRHVTIGVIEPAETLPDLRRRAVLIAEVTTALLDLMPASLGVLWPLGASLIEETDFRALSEALAEGLQAQREEEAEEQAEDHADTEIETDDPADPELGPEQDAASQAEPEQHAVYHTQLEEPAAPRT